MGHVTCLAETQRDALAIARAIRRDLSLPPVNELS